MAEQQAGNGSGNVVVEAKTYHYGDGSRETWMEHWMCEPPGKGDAYVVKRDEWSNLYDRVPHRYIYEWEASRGE